MLLPWATIEIPSNNLPGGHKVLLIMEEQSISEQPVVGCNSAWDEFEQLTDKSTVDTEI